MVLNKNNEAELEQKANELLNSIENFEINNRTIDVKSQTKIEIIGEGTKTYIEPDTGEEFNQGPTETKFTG